MMIKLFYRINIPPLSSFNFFASLCFVVSWTGRLPRFDVLPKNEKKNILMLAKLQSNKPVSVS